MKGFTLIETLVAITILTLAVAGPLVTANRAIVAARTARDQLTASYLAQEGIEYMRAVRDDAYLALHPGDTADAWSDFLTAVTAVTQCNATTPTYSSTNACRFDRTNGLSACDVGIACSKLYLANNEYTHTQSGGTATPFSRTVQVVDVSINDERIISKVSWSYHGTLYSVTIYDHLTPWQ